jgi:hypothetical protein
MRETLDDWTLDELLCYYVNYRKQVSPSLDQLLPVERFRLYAVSTRYPQKLATLVELKPIQPGVYEVTWGSRPVRILVLGEMPEGEHNTMWNLFSAVHEKVAVGASRYRNEVTEMSTIINQLFEHYQLEGLTMPYTMEDFRRDVAREYIDLLTDDEILQRFSTDELLQRFSASEVLQRLPLEDIRAYLQAQEKQDEQ